VLNGSVTAWLARSGPDVPLTVDALVGAIRDEGRFAIVRSQVIVAIERGDRFRQLSDGQGSYTPAPTETQQLGRVNAQVREGAV
jgi:hypothetical protein